MSTYSVQNINIDNEIIVSPGKTAGNVLTVNSDGTTYWGETVSPTQTLEQTLSYGNTSGTHSIGLSLYLQTEPVINSSVSGALTQSLTSNTYIYTLTGNTTFAFTNPTYSTYNFLIKAGAYSFSLSSGSNWQSVGATALGWTGSFVMSAIYDGTDMWVSAVKNYSSY